MGFAQQTVNILCLLEAIQWGPAMTVMIQARWLHTQPDVRVQAMQHEQGGQRHALAWTNIMLYSVYGLRCL